jgi:hypothetical protein
MWFAASFVRGRPFFFVLGDGATLGFVVDFWCLWTELGVSSGGFGFYGVGFGGHHKVDCGFLHHKTWWWMVRLWVLTATCLWMGMGGIFSAVG